MSVTIQEKLRLVRVAKELSQEHIGLKMGVVQQVISKWETEQKQPTLPKLISWAGTLGMEVTVRKKYDETE